MFGSGSAANFELRPDDIVYIPKSNIARVNQFVDDYIRGILMFNGWSFGITREIQNPFN
jgi:hypothetical protein